MNGYALEMKNIGKQFPGVRALDGVTFNVKTAEIHALVGENGAGKSTLMKILSGIYPSGSYDGEIFIGGTLKKFNGIGDSEEAGVAIIYQELALVKQLTVCENIFLGSEISQNGVIDWDESYVKATAALKRVGLNVSPSEKVINLGVGEQQLVEIAKALAKEAAILILDEPTAALTESEAENLLNILKDLRSSGVTCIYISHRLKEVFEISDRITVLRDGSVVCTENKADMNEDKLISRMVGRELTQIYPKKKRNAGDVLMEITDWTVYDPAIDEIAVDRASLKLRKGEILGIAGLIGAGRTELVMSLFGAWGRITSGSIKLEGKELKLGCAGDAIKAGISLVSEDRKRYGLVLSMDIMRNISLPSLSSISNNGVIDGNEDIKHAEKYVSELHIKTPSIEQKVMNLSGGNQQKVVLGKWLMTGPKVLILDEPTRGIDVGAKFEIYTIINELVDRGVGIIIISSELPEVLGMCDRVLVMHEGRFTGELSGKDATQEKVMYYATGGR
ncbi:MAG TPA: xylose ABC transporter ATP-binding protein [Candidatus Wallbacteria bacterium]|nr:xylose ABC transporter ATP-binding protein [Candidatus Wallbacteria bacterium]